MADETTSIIRPITLESLLGVLPEARYHRGERTIELWAGRRTGRPAGEIRTSDILTNIRPATGLRYQPRSTRSPLGGRLPPHLRHLEDSEAIELTRRADVFIAETPLDGGGGRGPNADDIETDAVPWASARSDDKSE